MTRQQADKILKAFTDISACDGNGESISIIMHELREAVEKQVPKKIERKKSHWIVSWYCPGCNDTLFITKNDVMPSTDADYCPYCGQRIEL